MTDTTVVNTWLPNAWIDENVPTPQADINAFLHCENGDWELRPADEDDRELYDYSESLLGGQIVPFDLNRTYGYFEVTLHEDGRIEGTGAIPSDANCFIVYGDYEAMGHSIQEAVENAKAVPGVLSILAYHWSGPYHFRFEINNGVGSFTQEALA